eukprot:PhF_6_TR20615/c0_g1_i1/m.29709
MTFATNPTSVQQKLAQQRLLRREALSRRSVDLLGAHYEPSLIDEFLQLNVESLFNTYSKQESASQTNEVKAEVEKNLQTIQGVAEEYVQLEARFRKVEVENKNLAKEKSDLIQSISTLQQEFDQIQTQLTKSLLQIRV